MEIKFCSPLDKDFLVEKKLIIENVFFLCLDAMKKYEKKKIGIEDEKGLKDFFIFFSFYLEMRNIWGKLHCLNNLILLPYQYFHKKLNKRKNNKFYSYNCLVLANLKEIKIKI